MTSVNGLLINSFKTTLPVPLACQLLIASSLDKKLNLQSYREVFGTSDGQGKAWS